jgi:hypothetical protein
MVRARKNREDRSLSRLVRARARAGEGIGRKLERITTCAPSTAKTPLNANLTKVSCCSPTEALARTWEHDLRVRAAKQNLALTSYLSMRARLGAAGSK